MKVAIVGGGAMGLAFAKRWLENAIVKSENLLILESCAARREIVQEEIGVLPTAEISALAGAQVIFLAVKPQDFSTLAAGITGLVQDEKLIVSIMAGVPVKTISAQLNNHQRIVRAMPNLPIVVGRGLTAYFAAPLLEPIALEVTEQLLSACGVAMRIENEDLMDAVTAVSGSGPGYIYYAVEKVMEQCSEFGFSQDQAKTLIEATFQGAIELWKCDKRSAKDLRSLVTSKGGTTEAGIAEFDRHMLGETLKSGLKAAEKRAKELSS